MSNDINEPKSRSLNQMATRPPNVKIWWPEPIFSGQLQILDGLGYHFSGHHWKSRNYLPF